MPSSRLRIAIVAAISLLPLTQPFQALANDQAEAPAPNEPPSLTLDQPFADPAARLREVAAATKIEKPADAVVLLREVKVEIDAEGRWTTTRHQILHLRTAAGAEQQAMFGSPWRPWHERRPEIKARVITVSGEERWLDPATIGEVAPPEEEDVLSDWRRLQAPLPAVTAGAVIETWARSSDEQPFFAGGLIEDFWAQTEKPTVLARFRVEAPAGKPIHFDLEGLPKTEPVHTTEGGKAQWLFEFRDLPARESLPSHLPPEVRRWPSFSVANGVSWATVARVYSEMVDAQLQGADLEEVLKPVLKGARSREEKVRRLVAWLHREVRYTGLEFGEAAIVPRTPAEVLARKYGDCKDKSALLAALLRQAGIEAHLALLKAGDEEVSPILPGLGNFNHAILYLPGKPEFWIDATAENTPVGSLPTGDLDRLALIASPKTTELTRTPPPAVAAFSGRTIYQLELKELGPANFAIQMEFVGTVAAGMRKRTPSILQGKAFDQLKKAFETIFDGKLADLRFENLDNLERPLILHLPFEPTDNFLLGIAGITLPFDFASDLKRSIPKSLWAEAEKSGKKTGESRQQDWYFPEMPTFAYRAEVQLPPAYAAADLPKNLEERWGPATFVRTTQVADGGRVEIDIRLSFDRFRFSAQEGEEFRRRFAGALQGGVNPMLEIEHVGEALLAEGHIPEAIAEMTRWVEVTPQRALPRARLARAYLQAGLGEAARAEINRAVTLEPDSAIVHATQGDILVTDLLGRELGVGWDPAGAEKAYRRAIELAPTELEHVLKLGLVLEHDVHGRRYSPGPRLDEAIALYRAHLPSPEAEPTEEAAEAAVDIGAHLMAALLRAGHFAEAEELAKSRAKTIGDYATLLAAIAPQRGSEAAIAALAPVTDSENRRKILSEATVDLLRLRHYGLAADLAAVTAGRKDHDALGFIAQLRRSRRHEEIPFDPASPESWAIRALRPHYLRDTPDEAWLVGLKVPAYQQNFRDRLENERRRRTRELYPTDIPEEVDFDSTLATLEIAVEEIPHGVRRVRYRTEEISWETLYLRPQGEGFEALEVDALPFVAIEADIRRMVAAGDLDGAKQWLDWARSEFPELSGAEPMFEPAFVHLWTEGQEATAEQILVVAAALRTLGDGSKPENAELLQKHLAAETDEKRRRALLSALAADALSLDAGPEGTLRSISWLEQLLAAHPKAESTFQILTGQYLEEGRFDRLQELADARLALLPRDPQALRIASLVAKAKGQLDKAIELSKTLLATGRAGDGDYNNSAWFELMADRATESTIALATKSVEHAKSADGSGGTAFALHTLATVYAHLGRPTEAKQLLLESLADSNSDEPRPPDWLVIGRIASHYGLADAARSAFARVVDEKEFGLPSDSAILARLWQTQIPQSRPERHEQASPAPTKKEKGP